MDYEAGFMLSTLKSNLENTDYVTIKIAEAETVEEQSALRTKYAEVLNQRKQWREQINKLEQEARI